MKLGYTLLLLTASTTSTAFQIITTKPNNSNSNSNSISISSSKKHNVVVLYDALSNSSSSSSSSNDNRMQMGLNEIQTLMREAVEREDYREAARLRDLLNEVLLLGLSDAAADATNTPNTTNNLSWEGLGAAPWLISRLDALKLKLPTTIQINAFASINSLLKNITASITTGNSSSTSSLEERMLQADRFAMANDRSANLGVVISGSTGSGKSLAFLVPTLSTLSESLFTRQRLRVKAEEDIGDAVDDLLARVAVTTSPLISGGDKARGVGGKDGRAALSTLGKSGLDIKSPLALIVVPTRELGVQTALTLFELVGGNTRRTKSELYQPGNVANMFKYKGPRGVKIGCVLDDQEAEDGLKLQTDIAITTPKYLRKLMEEGDVQPDKLRVIIFDEADLSMEMMKNEDINTLFQSKDGQQSRVTYLVGASVTDSLAKYPIVKEKMLPDGASYLATATKFDPIKWDEMSETTGTSENASKVLSSLSLELDRGLVHELCLIPEKSDASGLLAVCRMLRKELKEYNESLELSSTDSTIAVAQKPRVVVFFPDEETAKKCTPKLRDALWGDYKLCVLLPNTGVSPLQIMEQFKFNQTEVMLATPNSVRGLDFAGLTHVYTLYLPVDIREYLHLAGRVGRLGQLGSSTGKAGKVTTVLPEKDRSKFNELARQLKFDYIDVNFEDDGIARAEDGSKIVDESNLEAVRRYLEDKILLLDDDDNNEDIVE